MNLINKNLTQKFYFLGLPTYVIREKGNIRKHLLFNCIPLLRCTTTDTVKIVQFLGFKFQCKDKYQELYNLLSEQKEDLNQLKDSYISKISDLAAMFKSFEKSLTAIHTEMNSDFSVLDAKLKSFEKSLTAIHTEMNGDFSVLGAKLKSFEKSLATIRTEMNGNFSVIHERLLPITDFKGALEFWYRSKTGHKLDLNNPKSYNEKIQWSKLYDSTPEKTRLSDKYLVRDWIKEKIGEKYLVPLLGVYNRFDEIDFNKLPNQFVIKCTHGSGYNIIVKDKAKLNLIDIQNKITHWMKENFAYRTGYELHYRDIEPRIIIEKYIENEGTNDLYDYKFWCFDGKVYYIQFLSERNLGGLKMAFYDTKWKKQNFVYDYPLDTKTIEKPDNLEEMIKLAEKLAKGFNHVRVDFYRMNDATIYFGEMTFTSASGKQKWSTEAINQELGELIKLPTKIYDLNEKKFKEIK